MLILTNTKETFWVFKVSNISLHAENERQNYTYLCRIVFKPRF